MHPQDTANFVVHWNHETTIESKVEILSSFARDISSTAQHFVHTTESCSEIGTNRFRRNLETAKLHRLEYIHHLDQSSMGMCSLQLLCPGSCSPVQTVSKCSWHQDQNLGVKVCSRNCLKCDPNLPAIKPNSSHHSIHRNSVHHHTKNCSHKNCQWDTSVQLPEFLNLSLISSF